MTGCPSGREPQCDAVTGSESGGSPSPLVNAPRPGRGRRPAHEVRAAILTAADQLLRGEGMASFTIERVAALAGVSKMTIYRWWPTKGVLALEAYAAGVADVLAVPDTGDIEADLITQMTAFVRILRDTPAGRITAELFGAAQTDPDLAAAFRDIYLRPRRAAGITVLRAAQHRGQISADVDLEVLTDQLWGSCMYRLMTRDQPLTEGLVHTLVRNLLRGVRGDAG